VSKIKNVTLRIQVPNATAANTVTREELTLDNKYERCTGYALYEVNNTGGTKYKVALSNKQQGIIQDNVISDHLKTSTSVNPSDRFHKAEFRAAGEMVIVEIENLTLTTAVIDVVFRLEEK
jgi:hypothetical protein